MSDKNEAECPTCGGPCDEIINSDEFLSKFRSLHKEKMAAAMDERSRERDWPVLITNQQQRITELKAENLTMHKRLNVDKLISDNERLRAVVEAAREYKRVHLENRSMGDPGIERRVLELNAHAKMLNTLYTKESE